MQNLDTARAASNRFLIAALFLLSGVAKIAAAAMVEGYIAAAGLPAPPLGYLIAIIVEVGGGLLLLAGFHPDRRADPAGLLFSGRTGVS
jgi:putative oxidoreductase